MAKKKLTPRDECAASFEESLEELEKIVAELESGKLGLSDALERYEQGVKHLKSCQQQLERAERKIELLSGVDADGNPITQPFDEGDDVSLEAKAAARAASDDWRQGKFRPHHDAGQRHRRPEPAVLE